MPGSLAKLTQDGQHCLGGGMNRPQAQAVLSIVRLALSALIAIAFALASCGAQAQSTGTPTGATPQSAQPRADEPPQSAAQHSPAAPGDDLAQMRTDLSRMESLLGNMSSEIEFLHDQNLQILLRTNAQMWTTLIRDLRRQVDREQQQRGRMGQPEGDSGVPGPPSNQGGRAGL